MQKATLDTNCLVALSKRELGHEVISSLLSAHRTGRIELRLVAISATDLVCAGGPVQTLNDFYEWVSALGFGGVPVVLPLAIYDMVFYDGALWGDEQMERLYQELGQILFPRVYPPSPARMPNRNQVCDVLMMWSHVYHHGDIFVTTDGNFTKATKKPQLLALGAGLILTPQELAESISIQSGSQPDPAPLA